MLIRLSDNCHVAAEEIAEVKVSDYGHITVRMKNGVGHPFEPSYGESVYAAKDRLVREINATLAPRIPEPASSPSHPIVEFGPSANQIRRKK